MSRERRAVDRYFIPLTLTIRQREDGSFIATAKEIPVLLVAADRTRLAEKMKTLQSKLDALLNSMSTEDRLAFLSERGIPVERAEGAEAEEYSMPVLVGA